MIAHQNATNESLNQTSVQEHWKAAVPPAPDQLQVTVAQLLNFGVGYLPHRPELGRLIASADAGFERFLKDVGEGGSQFSYGREQVDDHDTGLIRRRGDPAVDGQYDNKDYFHFRYELVNNPVFRDYLDWLAVCGEILDECRACVRRYVQELQREFPKHEFASRLCRDETRNEDVLRLIHYRRTRPDTTVIARRHRGRAGVVLQVWENYPGLQGLVNGEWVPLGSSPTHFLCFGGLKLTQMTGGQIPALDHEVIHIRGAEKVQRRSVVAFINPLGVTLSLPTHNYRAPRKTHSRG